MDTNIKYARNTKLRDLNFTFYPTEDLLNTKDFKFITKVRCILLNKKGEVCMVSNEGTSNWMIPGGTLEKNENPIIALRREIMEEADITIKHYKLIGFLCVRIKDKNNRYIKRQDEMFFVAEIDKVLKQTTDPAKGYILKRKFFTLEDMCFRFMKWGGISDYLYNTIKLGNLFD